ncbi:MAG: hypothetical protein M3357_03230 [Actinomycetota bacterium]|nr:hypothetical protein [Actinomycetota bacterium]
MQHDMGGLWRQEVLRRIQEAQLADAARRPVPPPAPARKATGRWRVVGAWFRGRVRVSSRPVAQTEPNGIQVELGDEPVGV